MPFVAVCKRCNYHIYEVTRSMLNEMLLYHFLHSHKRRPEPEPKEAGKVTIAMPSVYYSDYYINLLTHQEYIDIETFRDFSEFWKGVNTKL